MMESSITLKVPSHQIRLVWKLYGIVRETLMSLRVADGTLHRILNLTSNCMQHQLYKQNTAQETYNLKLKNWDDI